MTLTRSLSVTIACLIVVVSCSHGADHEQSRDPNAVLIRRWGPTLGVTYALEENILTPDFLKSDAQTADNR